MKNFYYTFLALVFSICVTAQTTPTGTSSEVGITEGQLSVSLTGAATYSIPIAVPPGINGVVPHIGLVYNSQGGNGMAGYGWNISGVSAITRIPATKFHDGVVGGVNLDANDRFALDGQRLILKSGTYGVAGAIYETENFSNLKIEVFNIPWDSSRFYFKVFYPDGSVAVYNAEGTGSNSNYIIRSWTNAQGVTITYNYIYDGNTSYIDEIQYGHITGGSPINTIKFNYSSRPRPEQSYIGGISFNLSKILSSINVIANGVGFRNYDFIQETTTLKYSRLKRITEKDGNGAKKYNPTEFSYGNSNDRELFEINKNKSKISLSNINATNAATIVADFDGDSKNDFIVYAKTGPDAYKKCWIYNDLGSYLDIGHEQTLGNFTDIFPSSFLKGDVTTGFKLSPNQGWTITKDNGSNYTFDTYALVPVAPSSGYLYVPMLQYSKTVNFPMEDLADCYSSTTKILPKKILSGDFNGDGLTDVIAIDLPFDTRICDSGGVSHIFTINSKNVYYVNLKKNSTVSTTPLGTINETITASTKIDVIDFNSDGKSDFMILTEGKVTVYTLGISNDLIVLATYSDAGLKTDKPCLFGDYNGDGKTDFVIPQEVGKDIWCFYHATGSSSGFIKTQKPILENYSIGYTTTTDINGDWHHKEIDIIEYNYIANDLNGDGKTDIVRLFNQTFDHIDNYTTHNGNQKYENSDYTNQGKPLFCTLQLLTDFDIVTGTSYSIYSTNAQDIYTYPIPVFTNHTQPNLKLEFSLLTNNTINAFNCNKDNRIDTRLTAITTGTGVIDKITYKPLINDINYYDLNPYTPVLNTSTYPNIDINANPGVQVVTMLEKQSETTYKKQLFAYAGATSNLEGLGFMGFRATMQTNWYNDDSKIISSISKFEPNLRGANVENYSYLGLASLETAVNNSGPNIPRTSKITVSNTRTTTETLLATNSITFLPGATITPANGNIFTAKITPDYDANGFTETNTSPPSNLIRKTLSFYETTLSPTKVFKLQNVRSNTYNILENISSESNIEYDENNNPIESITKIRSGGVSQQTTTSTIAYDTVTTPYMVGRIRNKTQTVTTSGDTMNSKEVYGYDSGTKSNLLKTIEKYGNNTSAITETNAYDNFGNIITKTISASGIADRTTSFTYDSTNRFLKESTDIEGFKTAYDYYPEGTLKSEKKQTELNTWTNALDTGYEYDSWFRKKTVTDYMGKTHKYDYLRDNKNTKITLTGDTDGSYSEEVFDDLGRKTSSGVRDLQGNMSYTNYQNDIYDRIFAVSDPNSGSPSLWNTTFYNVYGYPETITDFTEKNQTIKFEKLTIKVTDVSTGQIKTSVKNAMGNVISMNEYPIGGTVNYSYFANGNLKETNYNGNKITITQDGWGRKTSLTDPSAGTYIYEYNALGEITKETTPNGATTYLLDNWGKLDTKTTPDSNTKYRYTNGLLVKTEFTDTKNGGKTITTDYTYDAKKHLKTIIETNGSQVIFSKTYEYDDWGRIRKETNKATLDGKSNNTVVENEYKNGFLYKIYEIKNEQRTKTLWEAKEVNARGQLKKVNLGNGIVIDNDYNTNGKDYGYLTKTKHTLSTTSATVMELTSNFDPQRGNLNWRTNSLFGNATEKFNYDTQDRLTEYPNALGTQETQYYEEDGRIESNALGAYKYTNAAKKYQNTSITLTPEAELYYQTKPLQTVTYNAFKSPVEIVETGTDKISFEYNDNNDRSVMFYGGEGLKNTRTYEKHYSADGSMEIKKNTVTGEIEFVNYIAGNGYTAPIVYKKKYDGTEQTLYLHRDYQGSIIAITNETGAVVEKRQFDAWGAVLKVQDGSGNVLNGLTVLDRGYTGHEHLQSVGLIHMNGRLYDPKLHRFLQPDNFIQDPGNTQNYNRYGYVLNNPLKYTDPSGEATSNPTEDKPCPECAPNFLAALFNSFRNPANKDWLSKNLSARSFDKAGTAVGKAFRDGANWVASGIGNLFGGGRSAPETRVANVGSNANTTSSGQYYGGDGSGSFMDYLSRFVYETDQFNPIALAWDGIKGHITGTDRYDNELSGFESSMKIVSAVPMTKAASIVTNAGEVAIFNGGKTFAQYKIARGGTETLTHIQTSTGVQRISTEFHHMFITQRAQRAYNLPNWLVNNRLNVFKLNTIQHSLVDPYRYRFLRAGIKPKVGWFGQYNWFTKF